MTAHAGRVTKQGSGGARQGSGRKPLIDFSEKQVKELVRAAAKKKRETKQSVGDLLMDLCYSETERTRLAALKIFYDKVAVGQRDGAGLGKTINNNLIVLPAVNQDPALKMATGIELPAIAEVGA